jgi:Flp pilus assembly protein TadD
MVLLTLALTVATIPAAQPQGPAATAAQIEKLIADGKADDAMQQGRAAVKARPDDVDLRLALARALAAKARKTSRVIGGTLSKEDIARGQAVVPGFDLTAAPLRVDYDQPLLEEAVFHLNFAIGKAKTREDLRVFQCFLFTDAGRIDRARVAITSALSVLPRTPALANTMTSFGVERGKRGDSEGAATLLAPVAAAFPDNSAVLVDYGNVLTRLGRKSDAYAALDRVTMLRPDDLRYIRTKAIGAMLLRDYPRARSAFDAAFRVSRGLSDELASFAAAYGVDPKASALLMRELAQPAASEDAGVSELANAFAKAGTSGAASEDAMTLARNLMTSQQFVLAIPVLDRAVKASPGNAEAKTMLKTTFRELGCESLAK